MPILAENKQRYPQNWPEIRAEILERAHNRCEFCGAPNHQWVLRRIMADQTVSERWWDLWDQIKYRDYEDICQRCGGCEKAAHCAAEEALVRYRLDGYQNGESSRKPVFIVLTVAHLDHLPENCNPANLKALCQRCHNRYDQAHRISGRLNRRRAKTGTIELEMKQGA